MDNSSAEESSCSSTAGLALIKSWLVLYFLLLPLFFYVLYVGYKQWKKQQSAMSHSDVFTFTITGLELLAIVAMCFYSIVIQIRILGIRYVGSDLFAIGTIGQMFIHSFACVERYLAVIHPIMYLRLKKRGGVTIRNVSIVSVWFIIAVFVSLRRIFSLRRGLTAIGILLLGFLPVAVVAFCSVSVLCVLIRPGPGEGGGDVRRIDQSKRRAFVTIVIILGVLTVRFLFFVVNYVVMSLGILAQDDTCLLSISASHFSLPSSVVLPVMFLHKSKKLPKSCVFNKRK